MSVNLFKPNASNTVHKFICHHYEKNKPLTATINVLISFIWIQSN